MEQKLLRTQMNPHFIFNSLGAINTFIQEDKSDEASDYLIKFSRLTRLILNNSRKEYISLDEEINTLKYYMDLQNMLSDGTINYNINVDEKLDLKNAKVPPMLAQPFIENSLKHGFKNKEGLKEINVKFSKSKNSNALLFEVQDNGIGINKAKEAKTQTDENHESFAMQITEERLTNLNKYRSEKIKIHLEELINTEGIISGTLVNFTIPYLT